MIIKSFIYTVIEWNVKTYRSSLNLYEFALPKLS